MKFRITEVTGDEPVTKEEAKKQLRVIHDEEDGFIQNLITQAREYIEKQIWVSIVKKKIILFLDDFPQKENPITLPRPPVQDVSSFTYTKKNGEDVTFEDYILDKENSPALIYPEEEWPDIEIKKVNGIKIEYQAGFEDIPKVIKLALLRLVTHWHENREPIHEGTTEEIPHDVTSLLNKERTFY